MNSVTFARSSRTDPDDGGDDWSGTPAPVSGASTVAVGSGTADASDAADPPDSSLSSAEGACVQGHTVADDGVLFFREGKDADALDAADVKQGPLQDCHLVACLAALSMSPEGRALLRGAITENKNEHGDVIGWSVTLHQSESHWLSVNTFRAIQVTVDASCIHGHAVARQTGPDESSPKEIWPLVLEKAVAQYLGGYDAINRGGNPGDVMSLLTGREVATIPLNLNWLASQVHGYGPSDLEAAVTAGKLVVLSTGTNTGAAFDLVDGHAYFVTGVESHSGQQFLRLGNPWGFSQPNLIPIAELNRLFSRVNVGSIH